MNPSARGGWLGLGLGDTRGTLMRAAFEGVAFSLRAGLDAIRASGADIGTMRLAGGGSIDPRWRQLLADALKVELHAVDCPNAATRGAALLGGFALGHWHAGDLASLAPSTTLRRHAERRCRARSNDMRVSSICTAACATGSDASSSERLNLWPAFDERGIATKHRTFPCPPSNLRHPQSPHTPISAHASSCSITRCAR